MMETALKHSKGKIMYVTTETTDISSTLIREAMINGDTAALSKMLHPSVTQYIATEKITFSKR